MSSERTEKAIKGVGGGKNLVSKNNLNQLLNRAIKFRKSRYVDQKLEVFKQRFAPVNGVTGVVHASSSYIVEEVTTGDNVDKNGFEQPNKILFQKDKLMSGWREIYPVGSGLKDLGQLSSLNAVLQICTYTPALANYFMEKRHGPNCTVQDYCFVCALEEHVRTALKGSTYALQPRLFAGKLKKMKNGNTKDVYNIWTFFTSQIQSFLLSEKGSKDPRVQETTALYQIFGGYLQNHLTCPNCNETENVYQSFLDIGLNIAQCSSVERALTKHFNEHTSIHKECTSCQKEGTLKGKKSIYKSPMSLVLQLQRFNEQGKNNKNIKFEETIDIKRSITPNDTDNQQQSTLYHLYAVIVHTGDTINAGHYIAYVKSSNGIWYCMDNDAVQQVSVKRLLSENPYILFYTVPPPPSERVKKPAVKKNIVTKEEEVVKENQESEIEDEDEEIPLIESNNQDEEEEEEKLRVAMEEAATKVKVDSAAAIVIQHDDNMKSKREKLGALIEKEMAVSKSAKAKEELLSKVPDNQFQDNIGTWNEDTEGGGAEAVVTVPNRKKLIKQLKHKRKKVDVYDLDYDRGKIKKIKNKQEDKFGKPNMFQITSDMKKSKKNNYNNKK